LRKQLIPYVVKQNTILTWFSCYSTNIEIALAETHFLGFVFTGRERPEEGIKMAGINRLARLLLVLLLTLIIAAGAYLVVEAGTRQETVVPTNLTANLVCQDTQNCYVEATLTAETTSLAGAVAAEIEGGVRFLNDAGRLVLSNNGHRAETAQNVLVPAGESRTVIFPLHPDKSTLYSGAYVMTLELVDSPVDDGRYKQMLHVHVLVRNGGAVHVLNDSPALDAAFGNFQPGTGRLAYAVKIDPLSRTQGTVYVRVNGVDNAIVSLSVPDGVVFTATGETSVRKAAGLIQPDGYRILAFSFQYAPGSYSGPRHITAGLNLGTDTNWSEALPFQLLVNDGSPAGQPFIQVLGGN
jgi:hypothetical protein